MKLRGCIGLGLAFAAVSAWAQTRPIEVDVTAELQCSVPALDVGAGAFGAGFILIAGPAVIAWGGAMLIKAIGAIR